MLWVLIRIANRQGDSNEHPHHRFFYEKNDLSITFQYRQICTLSLLLISVIPLKVKEDSKTSHYLYVKEHLVRDNNQQKPRNKTLFVINVPPYCTEVNGQTCVKGPYKIRHVFGFAYC